MTIEYDINVINFSITCGWRPETFIGDLGTIENVVKKIQAVNGCTYEEAEEKCRKMIALDVEDFLAQRMGKNGKRF
jgi:hypothetical protein